jgi:pimeloyl-ACP methyl ester carboxylesterase
VEPVQRDVVANGLRHRVLEWDGGGRTTALCLHGFLDSAWAFFEVAPRLARAGFHAVAPDLRGFGDSERVGAGGYYYFTDYLLDVADLVEALGRDRLALVGHSMGGGIAAQYAASFPERVWRAALLESVVWDQASEPPPRRIARWAEAVRRARGRPARIFPSLEDAADRIRQLDPRCPPATARALAEKSALAVDGGFSFKHDPLHVTPSPFPFDLARVKEFWNAVRCPVLLVQGGETELPIPADIEERIACFRDARQAVIPGAGHMMMRHRPEEVARLILEFLGPC